MQAYYLYCHFFDFAGAVCKRFADELEVFPKSPFLIQEIYSLKCLLNAYIVPGTLFGPCFFKTSKYYTVVSDVLNALKKLRG